MTNVAVVGLGYWGPNLVRNLASLRDVNIDALCDLDANRGEAIRTRFCPGARFTDNYQQIADDAGRDAVVCVTAIRTHFSLGEFFLTAGKYRDIETRLARTVQECQRLLKMAERNQQ